MVNLSITSVCQLSCSYCFAVEHLTPATTPGAFLDPAAFEQRLDFLDRSGQDEARLMGGEPTLHPRFPELVRMAHARGKRIVVFSNGLIPPRSLAALVALDPTDCTVLVNANTVEMDGDHRHQRRIATLTQLGERVKLGFNIYATNLDLSFLLDMIEACGSQRVIRLGLTHPTLSGVNEALLPSQYPVVGRMIADFARQAGQQGVSFDCGYVRCMFTDDDLADLLALEADVGWRCGPILDVDVRGNATHCYPLSQLVQLPMVNAVDAAALASDFRAQTELLRPSGIYQECAACAFKLSGECPGGCLATTYRRFQPNPVTLRVPV